MDKKRSKKPSIKPSRIRSRGIKRISTFADEGGDVGKGKKPHHVSINAKNQLDNSKPKNPKPKSFPKSQKINKKK